MFAIALAMTSCSSKDDYSAPDDNTIKLNYTVDQHSVGTRVGISGTDFITTTLPTGKQVAVYFVEAGTSNQISCDESGLYYWDYYTGENNTLTASSVPAWGDKNLDIIAVYPDEFSMDDSDDMRDVKTNQSTIDNYNSSDLLIAKAANKSKADGPITLNFKHALSKIIVNISKGSSGVTLSNITDIKINAYAACRLHTMPLSAVSVTIDAEASTPTSVLLGNYDSNGVTGIIPPQRISTTSPFITFKAGSIEYSYTPGSEIELKSGYQYTFNLTITKSNVKVSGLTITEWEPDPNNGTQNGNAE